MSSWIRGVISSFVVYHPHGILVHSPCVLNMWTFWNLGTLWRQRISLTWREQRRVGSCCKVFFCWGNNQASDAGQFQCFLKHTSTHFLGLTLALCHSYLALCRTDLIIVSKPRGWVTWKFDITGWFSPELYHVLGHTRIVVEMTWACTCTLPKVSRV